MEKDDYHVKKAIFNEKPGYTCSFIQWIYSGNLQAIAIRQYQQGIVIYPVIHTIIKDLAFMQLSVVCVY